MKAWTIIGFSYEADVHCEGCTVKRFGSAVLESSDGLQDSEGNEPHPIFASEIEEEEPRACGTCGEDLTF